MNFFYLALTSFAFGMILLQLGYGRVGIIFLTCGLVFLFRGIALMEGDSDNGGSDSSGDTSGFGGGSSSGEGGATGSW